MGLHLHESVIAINISETFACINTARRRCILTHILVMV